jgi:glycosyltransferase involved in cell wall biosynthesis
MHFCFLMPQLEYYSPVSGGAIATVTAHVSRELVRDMHRVDVIASECYEPVYEDGTVHEVKVRTGGGFAEMAAHLEARLLRWDSPHGGRYYSAGLKLLEKLQPDAVVLANDFERITAVRRVLPGVCIVVWLHNECRLRTVGPGQTKDADVFLCCSDYIRSWVVHEYALDPSRVHTAHAGIDEKLFSPAIDPPRQNELRVLFTGRLDPNKGVDIAVRVVGRLRRKGLPIRLSVAGNVWFYAQKGKNPDPFQSRLRSAMKNNGVDWMGHVPRRFLPEVMRRHDVAMVPSRSEEPFGLVVLESMASGLAVLASPRGGLIEACGGAAMLVDPDDSVGIETFLERLCSDRSELDSWKVRSLQRAKMARWGDTARVLCRAVGARSIDLPSGESASFEKMQL